MGNVYEEGLNSYHRTLEQEDSVDFTDAAVDFAKYGIGSAILSGGVGLFNTAKSIGNVFGADFDRTEVGATLDGLGFNDAADYYQDNSALVDGIGLVVGSIVPGVLGLRAARAAQAGLRGYSGGSKAVQGLRKAMVPKQQAKAMREAMGEDSLVLGTRNARIAAAAKEGFHQAAIEGVFIEAAILAGNAENSSLSSGELSYFDGIGNNLGMTAFGIGFGTALGGIAKTVVNFSAIKHVAGEQLRKEAETFIVGQVDTVRNRMNIIPGDRLTDLYDKRDYILEQQQAIASGSITANESLVKDGVRKLQKMNDDIVDEITLLTSEMIDKNHRTNVLTTALHETFTKMKPEDKYSLMTGLQKVGTMEDFDTLFNPKAIGLNFVDDDAWMDVVGKGLYGKGYRGSNDQKNFVKRAFGEENGTLSFTNDGKDTTLTIRNKIFESGTPEEAAALLRFELGKGNTSRLREVLDMKGNIAVRDELEALSKLNRPKDWANAPVLAAKKKNLTAKLATATHAQMEALSKEIDGLDKITTSLSNPNDMLADAWALLSNPVRRDQASAIAPNVLKAMEGNNAIKTKLGISEALVDLKSGDSFSVADRMPTIRDKGNVTYIKSKALVKYNGGEVQITPEYSVITGGKATGNSVDEASAHYYASSRKPALGKKTNAIVEWENFPEINRMVRSLEEGTLEGLINIKMDGVINKTYNVTKDTQEEVLGNLKRYYKGLKIKAIQQLRVSGKGYDESSIARIVDTDENFVYANGNEGGLAFWSSERVPTQPTIAKFFYKNKEELTTPFAPEALANSRLRIREVQLQADGSINALLAKLDRSLASMMPDSSTVTGINYSRNITAVDDTIGVASAAQGNYGAGSSFAQTVAAAHGRIRQSGHDAILTEINAAELAVRGSEQAVMESAALDTILRQRFYAFVPQIPEGATFTDVLNARVTTDNAKQAASNIRKLAGDPVGEEIMKALENTNTIWTTEIMDSLDTIVNAGRFSSERIRKLAAMVKNDVQKIQSPELANYWKANVKANGLVVEGKRTIAGIKGLDTNIREDVLYPGTLDTKRYQFVEFVEPTVSGIFREERGGIIGAPTAELLKERVAAVKAFYGDKVNIYNKEKASGFFERYGINDDALKLNEHQFNSELKRAGVLWDVAPEPTVEIFDHYKSQLLGQWSRVTDNLTQMKYSEEFASLEAASDMAELAKSKFPDTAKLGNNFRAQAALMLNKTDKEAFTGWRSAQEGVDKMISSVYNTVKHSFLGAGTTADYAKLDGYLKSYGIPSPYDGKVGEFLVRTEGVPDQVIASLVPKLNGAAATMMLRFMELSQPLINAISTPITAVPEIKHLLDSVGELARQQATMELRSKMPQDALRAGVVQLDPNMPVPEYSMTSNLKLMQQAVKDYFSMPEMVKEYYQRGYTSSIVREMRDASDNMALDPAAIKAAKAAGKQIDESAFKKTVDLLSSPADWSEGFVKFTAARMADLTLTAAGITNVTIKNMAINTFIKRVHGNYTYAQRPALFQGIGGQAIGLFQTYQFNLFQQLLRHVGDKQVAAASSMIGLQAGMFGTQSVPGFRMMSDHIGERSLEGNDFYTGTTDALGSELSEWMLYGLSSNLTKAVGGQGLSLYTRGDLNPRTPFIIPTTFEEIPIVALSTKFLGAMANAATKLADGGPSGQIFLEALGSNGVNRPLAGLGQLLSGAKTTSKGTLVTSTQDLGTVGWAARLMGTQTLDENIAVQSFYRAKGYETYRQEKMNSLGQRVRTAARDTSDISAAEYSSSQRQYVEFGGKIDGFDSWMHRQSMSATESQIDTMYKQNDSPEGRYLQRIMGGDIEKYIGVKYE